MNDQRVPPSSHEAEKSVLGSILCGADFDEVAALVSASDFHNDSNAKTFTVLRDLHRADKPTDDSVLLAEELDRLGILDDVNLAAYIIEIVETVAHAEHAAYYAAIVAEKSRLRQIIYASGEAIRNAYGESLESGEIAAQYETRLHKIIEASAGAADVSEMYDNLAEVLAELDSDTECGLPTGFVDLDELTLGMRPQSLIYLAARPSMGKTAFAGNVAMNVAKRGEPVLIVSLEQSRGELTQRFLASDAKVNGKKLQSKKLVPDERRRVVESSNRLNRLPIAIDDTPTRTISQIAAVARLRKRRSGLSLIVVDYLQLIEPETGNVQREQQVATMSRALKGLARSLDIPVLALAQLNRNLENRDNKRPRLSDLRESGSIEQDANQVWLMYRPAEYAKPGDDVDEADAELIVAKHRNGETGFVNLRWDKTTTTFSSAARSGETGFD